MSISDKIHEVKSSLPEGVNLVAVSKFHGPESVQEAYDAGQRIFGESRMQEINQKKDFLPQDIEWHFIGHLQTNKIKAIIPYIHTIQSVDSWKLFSEIEKYAVIAEKRICCLLEIHMAQEDAKYGFTYDACRDFLSESPWRNCKYAYIGGIMGMATNTDNEELIRKEFHSLKLFFEEIKDKYFYDNENFKEISMGMSDDYRIAIQEGSTMIRVGSSIFGTREY
ncbi:MAG: YggS family pyridoxal phosphate-dependent enzyme [Dysgonomonas sp.]